MSVSSRPLALLVLAVLATACDARENGLGPGTTVFDRTRPTVVSTNPSNGSTQASRINPITITFSEPMRASSMIASTFTFTPSIAGTVSYTANTATIVPSGTLAGGVVYTGTVTTAAEDASGNNLATAFTWTFTTDPAPVLSR
jgi:hypothetical protein